MDISIKEVTQKFNNSAVFQPVTHHFQSKSKTVILGPNGSGKSTLLQVLSSFIEPTEGEVKYSLDKKNIEGNDVWKHIAVCSPFLELEENFSLSEAYKFHFSLTQPIEGISESDFFDLCFLKSSKNKSVKQLSSGMRQRLKLAFTFLTESSAILLDEPCVNLDEKGKKMYTDFIQKFSVSKTQIVCSNSVKIEYQHCNAELKLLPSG